MFLHTLLRSQRRASVLVAAVVVCVIHIGFVLLRRRPPVVRAHTRTLPLPSFPLPPLPHSVPPARCVARECFVRAAHHIMLPMGCVRVCARAVPQTFQASTAACDSLNFSGLRLQSRTTRAFTRSRSGFDRFKCASLSFSQALACVRACMCARRFMCWPGRKWNCA